MLVCLTARPSDLLVSCDQLPIVTTSEGWPETPCRTPGPAISPNRDRGRTDERLRNSAAKAGNAQSQEPHDEQVR
jgi:hypothetical protein